MQFQKILVEIIIRFNYFVFGYLSVLNVIYTILMLISFGGLYIHIKRMRYESHKDMLTSDFIPPISILVPAYNEEKNIVGTVTSLQNLKYGEYEIIVINDGSKDDTLQKLIDNFDLKKIDMIYERKIKTEKIRGIYLSKKISNFILIDKDNGGKGDALNAGINVSNYPLVTSIDADSVLEENSLLKVARPFIENPEKVVAAGGIVRISNGCKIKDGMIEKVGLSKNSLSIFQTVEYLRAFLSGRVGWSIINGLLIVSGTFAMFRKDILTEIGGFCRDSIGEDMEIIVHIHKHLRRKKRKYKIEFIPDPVCWTQGPLDLKSLRNQRIRWQRGMMDALFIHRTMFFNIRYGLLGLLFVPYFWIYEMFGSIIEILGYFIVILSLYFGIVDIEFAVLFFSVAVLYGIFLSIGAVILEEYSFRRYEKISDFLILVFYATMENFGFRQLQTWWRFRAFFGYRYKSNRWGKIERHETHESVQI